MSRPKSPGPTTPVGHPRPPVGYCVAAILMTWLGLLGAGLNLQWSAAPPTGDGLRSSWLYTNIMVGFLWLLFWPAAAMRGVPRASWRSDLLFQWLAMLIGAIPSLWLAAFFSGTPAGTIGSAAFTQLSFSIFSGSLIALARKYPGAGIQSFAAFFLAAPATVGPVFYFLLWNFFPTIPTGWSVALPPMCTARAAQLPAPSTLITAAAYLLIGCGVLIPAAPARSVAPWRLRP